MFRLCVSLVLSACLLCPYKAITQTEIGSDSTPTPVLTPKGLEGVPTFTDIDLRNRVLDLPASFLPPHFNSVVKGYIHRYVMRSREHTEDILGRAALYFPIIEQQLVNEGLPLELRCLPIVESALNPNAISPAHAVGLWQFMSETAREQGLRIDRYVDERRDPHRSTEGALAYLRKLHGRFGDWALALAAYNAGAGRVNRAIRRAQSTDYWKVREFLPRETSNYVPAFIAALYVWNYAHLHNLKPQLPERELRHTCRIKIFDRISFAEISKITNVSVQTLTKLNPAIRRGVVPASSDGLGITTPAPAAGALLDHLNQIDETRQYLVSTLLPEEAILREWREDEPTGVRTFWHQVQKGENLISIAQLYRCQPEDLIRWNQLSDAIIKANEHLVIHAAPRPPALFSPICMLPVCSVSPLPVQPRKVVLPPVNRLDLAPSPEHITHYLERGESLVDLLQLYPHAQLEDILSLNNFSTINRPRPGDLILVPAMP